MIRKTLPALAFFAFGGCANLVPGPDAGTMQKIEATRPTCTNDRDCAAKWDAAQLWVVKHAGYKIQTATNVVIQTYGPIQGEPGLAVIVTREPAAPGTYRIVAHSSCNLCDVEPADAMIDFNRTVGAATP